MWSDVHLAALGVRDPGAFRAVLAAQVLNGLGYGLVFPILALQGEALGLGAAAITWVVAVHPLARLLTAPAWGSISDHLGRRGVLIVGIALQAAGHALFAVSGSVGGLALARVLTGIGSGDAVATTAMVADLSPPEGRAAALGLWRSAAGLGVLLGPVLGGLLGMVDLRLPCAVAAVACLANLLQVVLWCPETVVVAAPSARGPRPPAVALLFGLVTAASIGSVEAIGPLVAEHVVLPAIGFVALPARQAAVGATGSMLLAWGATTALADARLSPRIVAALGPRAAMAVGAVAWAVVYALTPLVLPHGLVASAVWVVGTGLSVSLAGVAWMAYLSRSAAADAQGRAGGLAQAASALGEFVGPAIAGTLYAGAWGLPFQFWAGALLLAAATVAVLPPDRGRAE